MAVENIAAVVQQEEGLHMELAVRRTVKELGRRREVVVAAGRTVARIQQAARHMAAEAAQSHRAEPEAVGSNRRLVGEEDRETAPEEGIDLEEVVGSSPGCLPAALLAVSVRGSPVSHSSEPLLTAIGGIVWIRHSTR